MMNNDNQEPIKHALSDDWECGLNALGYGFGRFLAACCKAGPVVEIDDVEMAVWGNNGITAIDSEI